MNVSRFGIARLAAFIMPAIIALAACAAQPTPTPVPPTVAPTAAPTQAPVPTTAPMQVPGTSAPPGPVARFNVKFEVPAAPTQFDVIQLVQDFAPGAASALHSHGGQGFATVLEGEITIRTNAGEKKYKAGETFTETVNEPLQALNTSAANTTFAITFLLPKGAALTTSRQPGIPEPSPAPVVRYTGKFEVSNPPTQFDLIHLVQEFAPGAATPRHSHGGQGYATMLDGEIMIRTKDGEKKFKAGETFTANTNEILQVYNLGGAKAVFSIVFLLPKGATLTTAAP
jgi:quercetin dioxygenase-like cupin family protein